MKLDVEKYLHHLDDPNLSRAQKEQIIRTVWSFMEAFVDQAFGLHPVQKIYGRAANDNLQNQKTPIDSKKTPVSYCFGNAANDNQHARERKKHGQK